MAGCLLRPLRIWAVNPAYIVANPKTYAYPRKCKLRLQGVFLTFARLANGQNSLTRIRFNRQHFDKAAASVWWQTNKAEMGLRYNIASNSGTPTGLHTPDSESAPPISGASPPHHR